ncbi:MAG: 4-amino-4-deoxychorismate lyase [Acidimicrobiales bacterium]|nr:4-amino-4-deoxychorismate lyase [Acidimicrobiales bacterium]
MNVIWVNGVLADEHDPSVRVSAFDHGLLTGDGIFETVKICAGRPFAMRRHLERLARSAAGLGLACPDTGALLDACAAVVAANGIGDGRARITVTGGPSPLGSDRGELGPTVIVASGPLPPWPPTTDVAVCPWPRNEHGALTGLKTISYGENVVALAWARRQGAGEAIFANSAGNLCEGTGSNVFVVRDGQLVTPPLSSGCLAGVTRELLLELTDAVEADVPIAALAQADEAFLTSSTREVQPIRAVDGRVLPAAPGGTATAALTALRELVGRDIDP